MSFASKAKSGSPPGPGIASSLSNASTQTSFATRAALSSKTTATGPKLKATLHARSSSLPANNVLNPNRKILDTLNHNLVSKPSKRTPDAAAPNITNRTVGSATQVENTRPKASYDLGPGVSKRSPNHISSVAKLSLNALPKSPKSPPRTHVRPTSAPAGIPSFARPTSTSTARVTSASLPKATAKSPSTNAKSTPGGTTPSARSGALRRRMTVTQRPASKTTTTTAQKINAEALDTVIECAKVEKAKADTLSAAIGIGNEDKEMTFGDTEVEELSELRLAYDDSSSDSLDGLGLGEIIDSFPAPSTYIPEPNISIVGDPATTESSPPASSALPTPPLSPVSAACQPLPKGLYKPKGFLDVPRWDFENIPRHAQSRNVAATTRQARRLTMRAPPIVSPFVRRTSFAAMRTARTKPSTAFKTSLGNLTEGVDEAKELQEKTQIPECGGSEGPAVDPKLNGVGSKESRIGSVRNVLHSDRPQGSQQDEDAAVLSRIFHDSVLSDTEADIQDKSLSSPTVKAPEMVKKMAKAGSQDESSSESFDSYPGVLEEIIEFYSDLGDSDGSSGDAPGDADKDVSALLTETTTSDIAAANISQAEDRTDKELVIKIAKSLLEKDSDEDLVKDVDAARVLRPYAIESSTISHSDSLAGEIDFAKNLAHSLAAATVWSESSFDESFSFSDEELPWLTGVDKGKDPDIQLESDQSGEEDLSQQSVEETEETSDDEEAEEKQVEAILNEPAIIYSPQYAAEFLEGGSSSIYAEATVGYHSEPYHREQPEKILEEPPKGRNLKYIGRGLDGDMEIHLWFDVEEEVIVQKPVISPVGQSERQDAQSVFRSPHFAPEPTSCKSTSTIAGHAASFPNEACLATQPPPAPSPPSCASPAYRNPPAPAFVGRNAIRPVNTIKMSDRYPATLSIGKTRPDASYRFSMVPPMLHPEVRKDWENLNRSSSTAKKLHRNLALLQDPCAASQVSDCGSRPPASRQNSRTASTRRDSPSGAPYIPSPLSTVSTPVSNRTKPSAVISLSSHDVQQKSEFERYNASRTPAPAPGFFQRLFRRRAATPSLSISTGGPLHLRNGRRDSLESDRSGTPGDLGDTSSSSSPSTPSASSATSEPSTAWSRKDVSSYQSIRNFFNRMR